MKDSLAGLKGILSVPGCELHVHIYPQNRTNKKGTMTFLAGVDTSLVFNGQVVAKIRGAQKKFTSNGNQLLDFTNSNDSDYPNSSWDKALAEIISTGSIQVMLEKVGTAAVHRSLTVDAKTGKFVAKKLERTVTQAELGDMAKDFISGIDEHADAKPDAAAPSTAAKENRAAI